MTEISRKDDLGVALTLVPDLANCQCAWFERGVNEDFICVVLKFRETRMFDSKSPVGSVIACAVGNCIWEISTRMDVLE